MEPNVIKAAGIAQEIRDRLSYALQIGTVTTTPAGTPASAEITGTGPIQQLNLSIPQGAKGADGEGGGGGSGAEVIHSTSPTNLRGAPYWGKDCKGFIFGLLRDTPTTGPSSPTSVYQFYSYQQNSPASIAYEQIPAIYEISYFTIEVVPGLNYEVQITKLFGFADGITPIYRIAMLEPGAPEVKYGPWQDSSAYKVPSLRELLTTYVSTAICPALWGAAAKSGSVFRADYSSPSLYSAYLPSASAWVPYGLAMSTSHTLSPPIYSAMCSKPNVANTSIVNDLKLVFAFAPETFNGDFNNKSFTVGVASEGDGHAVIEYYEDYEETGSPKLFYEYFDPNEGVTKVELSIIGTVPLAVGLNFLEISYVNSYSSVTDSYSANFQITLYSKDAPSGYSILGMNFDPYDYTGSAVTPAFPDETLSIDKLVCANCLWFAEFPIGYPPELYNTYFYTKIRDITNHAYGLDYDSQMANFQFP